MKRIDSHHNRVIFGFFAVLLLLSGFSVLAVRDVGPYTNFSAQTFKILPDTCKNVTDAADIKKRCNFEAFLQLIANVVDAIIKLIFIIAPILIVFGGIVILTSGGSTERISKGKDIIKGAVIGIVVALASYLIISTVVRIITSTVQ